MKKFLSLILALAMVACMSVTAFAYEDIAGTTKVNVEVPDNTPSYVFHCPASVSITYGENGYQDLGEISITDVKNIAYANIHVELDYTNLINIEDDDDYITMILGYKDDVFIDYKLCEDGSYGPLFTVRDEELVSYAAKIAAYVSASEWEKATPGATYQATVTYVLDVLGT
ncbi:MAG: hypothetical protein MJ134_04410 [Lachnospiraceae bacterium]|nr:hypothetical protein [Lachnospiraceae bacterium]